MRAEKKHEASEEGVSTFEGGGAGMAFLSVGGQKAFDSSLWSLWGRRQGNEPEGRIGDFECLWDG